jgi:hypothetical protein
LVPGVNDVRLLVKDPVPLPSDVLLLDIVGFSEVFQQTPLEVTSAPPSPVTFPPDVAVVWVIAVTLAVVTTGRVGFFLQEVRINVELIKRIIIAGIFEQVFITLYF